MTDSRLDLLDAHPSLLETLSWRLCSELARRHPTATRLIETHPGGGQYDCLTLVDVTGPEWRTVIDANRQGSIHITAGGRDERRTWAEYATSPDPRAFLLELERAARLDPPPSVPAATPMTLSYRAIAAAIGTAVLSPKRVSAHNGMYDSSGGDGGIRDDLYRAFPETQRPERPGDAYPHWFLTAGGDAQVLIDTTTADVMWADGTCHNLHAHYRGNGRHLLDTVSTCLRPAVR